MAEKKSGFFAEFKKFIMRGNIVDMSVGVIVGGAFTAIVTALSNNILKPIINWVLKLVLGKDSLAEIFTFFPDCKVYKDVVDEAANWTKEGITSLGLYAQQMEVAEMQAKEYKEEINYLNKNWQKLGYTEQEYIEKLEELKDGQYDAIQSYHDAKDAIVDLNSERIDAIKEGIEKEIEAYSELIEKKKEALDAEKD